jgi:hypothetical protein
MLVLAATSPVPNDPQEPALLTLSEYLHRQNSDGKSHPADAYDWGLDKERQMLALRQHYRRGSDRYSINILPSGLLYFTDEQDHAKPVAYIKDGVLYMEDSVSLREIPHSYQESPLYNAELIPIRWESKQRVKYVGRYIEKQAKIDRDSYLNKRYPVTLQHIKFRGEPFTVKTEETPTKDNVDKGNTIAVINTDNDVVASASSEWGATLIQVTREYRGYGIGPWLAELWYKYNPSYRSGGFTSAGKNNAKRMWMSRVRLFLQNGWYSELIRQGKMTPERVREIAADLEARKEDKAPVVPEQHRQLIFADDTMFILFDSGFFKEYDDSHIHGFGFLRESQTVGTFFYAIDWDEGYEQQVATLAMQLAYDCGEPLYIAGRPAAVFDPKDVKGVEIKDGYAKIEKPLFDLKAASAISRKIIAKAAPHMEALTMLLEEAHAKWD